MSSDINTSNTAISNPEQAVEKSWIVLKFGGTSVTGLKQWQNIQSIITKHIEQKQPILMVCSAISQVSNHLEDLARAAQSGADITPYWEKIFQIHQTQAQALDVPLTCIEDMLTDLKQLAFGSSLIKEVSAKLWARILSAGELMSTRLGVEWLKKQKIKAHWLDAREALTSNQTHVAPSAYQSATVTPTYQPEWHQQLNQLQVDVVITQGFIARNSDKETVLLGRGGSDTSASYFAVMLDAKRLEIWTDVPGMFTANPKVIPSARLLKEVSYEEAQELATTGAKVLHPRAIPPVRSAQIPLHIYSTLNPELSGTQISNQASGDAQIKGVSLRKGIYLISMNTLGMWQQAGFLAEVFNIFKRYDISIDLIATSESNVTLSLDNSTHLLTDTVRHSILEALNQSCHAQWIGPVASVSLVGRQIRSILHQLGPIFERFADQKVHLLTQAASDLNLTVVVEESQAEPLMRQLHHLLFSKDQEDRVFGSTWNQLFSSKTEVSSPKIYEVPWWVTHKNTLLTQFSSSTPAFVYHRATLIQRAQELLSLTAISQVFYAIKANPHPEILSLFEKMNLGFECVSPQELSHVRSLFPHLPKERLLFTSNFVGAEEYQFGFNTNAIVTLDSIFPLRMWPEVFANREILVRIDTGKGKGHHQYVVTAGNQSKFGIPPQDFDELISLTQQYHVKVIGLHAHSGSGILEADHWQSKAYHLYTLSQHFQEIRVLNLGGGFGVPERGGQARLDLKQLNQSLQEFKDHYSHLDLWIEPGRYLVSEAGILLTRVTQLKTKGDRMYVGVDCGMNSLIRPALYGAWHHIENLTQFDQPKRINADIVGPICESGDVLGRERSLPQTYTGDMMLISHAGAYGRSMSSYYNLRAPAEEYFTD